MSLLSRVYLVLLTALLIIFVTLLLISPDTTIIGWGWGIAQQSPVLRIVAAGLINVLLLALLYLQIRPSARASVDGLEMRASGTITEVSVESARERILRVVRDVPDVVSVEAAVKSIRGRADVDLQVVVLGDEVRLPKKQQEISRALKQVIYKQLGLRLAGRPRVHLRLYSETPVSKPAPAPAYSSGETVAAPAGVDTLLITPPASPLPIPPQPVVPPPAELVGGQPEAPIGALKPAEPVAREPWDAPDVDTINLAEPVRVAAGDRSAVEETSADLADLVAQAKATAEPEPAEELNLDLESELAHADLDELVETSSDAVSEDAKAADDLSDTADQPDESETPKTT